jgi:tripartite-type tricarboxylate transporter receptor subunit TctC
MKRLTVSILLILLLGTLFTFTGAVLAEEYPDKTIQIVVPWGAGGGTDKWTRALSTVAIENYGQPWSVVNIPGSSGMVGWKEMLDRPADGYTIMSTGMSNIIAPIMDSSSAPYTPEEVRPVAIYNFQNPVLIALPDKEWSTWEGLKNYLTENPGRLTIGSALGVSIGTTSVLEQAGLEANLVIYDSTGEAITDLLGGHIDFAIPPPAVAAPLMESGDAVAVLNSGIRDIDLPKFEDVPSAADLGYTGFSTIRWMGMHPDTPDEIVQYANKAIGEMIKSPSFQSMMKSMGEKPVWVPLEEVEEIYNHQAKELRRVLENIDL